VQCIEFKHETKLTSGDSDSAEISISDTDHLVCVCVCVRERERERQRQRKRTREREKDRHTDAEGSRVIRKGSFQWPSKFIFSLRFLRLWLKRRQASRNVCNFHNFHTVLRS